jgi:hypothetical protein
MAFAWARYLGDGVIMEESPRDCAGDSPGNSSNQSMYLNHYHLGIVQLVNYARRNACGSSYKESVIGKHILTKVACLILGSHGGVYEDNCLLGCSAV